MKQNFYKITSSNRFQTVIAFLRKELGWKPSDALVRPVSCGAALEGAAGAAQLIRLWSWQMFASKGS